MGLRDIKAQARGDLHLAMRVPIVYVEPNGTVHRDVHARVLSKFDAKGDMQGTSFNYAEAIEKTPKLIFWRSELDRPVLQRLGKVVVSSEEGYLLDTFEPPDNQTVTVMATPLKPSDVADLPQP